MVVVRAALSRPFPPPPAVEQRSPHRANHHHHISRGQRDEAPGRYSAGAVQAQCHLSHPAHQQNAQFFLRAQTYRQLRQRFPYFSGHGSFAGLYVAQRQEAAEAGMRVEVAYALEHAVGVPERFIEAYAHPHRALVRCAVHRKVYHICARVVSIHTYVTVIHNCVCG